VLFDEFADALKDGSVLDDLEFELYEYDEEGNVVKRKYRGAWLLVDNGYLAWSVTVPPIKTTTSRTEIRFSEWLESMRKDVECTFGILKGRWRILKTGIRLHGIEAADKIWLTCCALHNWLLVVDGLDKDWEQGVQSDWQGELGEHEAASLQRLPEPLRRLHYPAASHNIGFDREQEEWHVDNNDAAALDTSGSAMISPASIQEVRKLGLSEFRARLMCHFDIA